ncbi:glutathione-regulated potassium-efflux system ancillary protein KefF [Escherichia coli TA271]|nr:glutathione-regulated potassium-efflux system ancillary protein KefF [Escherichia coli TA271]
MILIIYAHPYPHHSHANKRMLEQARTLEGVEIRSLYQLYPDFNIDIAAEQEALSRADLIVWQHPMQWYSIPPLLKLWIDKVSRTAGLTVTAARRCMANICCGR